MAMDMSRTAMVRDFAVTGWVGLLVMRVGEMILGRGLFITFLRHRCENLFSDFLIQIQSRDFPLEESCPRKPKSLAQ